MKEADLNPCVSVIIAAFNAASSIGKAVESALAQTLQALEVIVVDDCSSDLTVNAAIDAAKGDPRLRILRSSVNGGPSASRNIALASALGQWVALLDADDTMVPERLEALVATAERLNADLVADRMRITYPSGPEKDSSAFLSRQFLDDGPISAATFVAADRPYMGFQAPGFCKALIRRSFLEEKAIRYHHELRIGEDFHLYVHCILRGGRFFFIPHAFYQYNFHHTSLSRGAEARKPLQLVYGNLDLERIASAHRDVSAAKELRKRGEQLDQWLAYLSLKDALSKKKVGSSLKHFAALPSRRFAVEQLSRAAVRRCSKFFA